MCDAQASDLPDDATRFYDLYGRARRRTVAVWVPRVSCERASYRMAGTAAVVAGL